VERIGKLLKEEQRRFMTYPEIEARTEKLGFPVSVRTLRFYVEEGILPTPNKLGKSPVFDESWVLNVLLSLHIMKTRLGRSLKDIRQVLQNLNEDPVHLADKLSVLYEDQVVGGELKPVQREWLIDSVFALLEGRGLAAIQPSELDLGRALVAIEEHGIWKRTAEGSSWEPPDLALLRAPKARGPIKMTIRKKGSAPAPAVPVKAKRVLQATPRPARRGKVEETVVIEPEPEEPELLEEPSGGAKGERSVRAKHAAVEVPAGAVSLEEARSVEDFFLGRIETEFQGLLQLVDPMTGKLLAITGRTCSPLSRDHSASIIQRMKSLQIYDRELLDQVPLERAVEFHLYRRSFFGRNELRVVVAALSLSPVDDFLTKRYGDAPLGSQDILRAIKELVVQDGIFYYVGLLSTTGWTAEARSRVPQEGNLACLLIEQGEGSGWRIEGSGDERWGMLGRVFDPETDAEKLERVKGYLKGHEKLSLKGGHVVIQNVVEDLRLPEPLVRDAMEDLLRENPEFEFREAAGYEVLMRRRM